MLAMITYVDNLDRCHYDIPFLVKNWFGPDRVVIVYSGSDATTTILNKVMFPDDLRVEIIQVPVRIVHPQDIPAAFNYCVDMTYRDKSIDAVCLAHSDAYVTARGIGKIMENYSKWWNAALCQDVIQLYAFLWSNIANVVLSHRSKIIHWDTKGDGTKTVDNEYDVKYNWETHQDPDLALDIGYMTIETYKNKLYSHNFIWPDAYKGKVLDAFGWSEHDGLRMVYNGIRQVNYGAKLVPIIIDRYLEVLDHYNAWDEYRRCLMVMNEVNNAY